MAKPMLPHFGDPVEIGYMMLFLLSGASTYLTGQDFLWMAEQFLMVFN
ncbi:MAG: hypothetical protein ACLVBJ_06365 [Pilosibacter sp.]